MLLPGCSEFLCARDRWHEQIQGQEQTGDIRWWGCAKCISWQQFGSHQEVAKGCFCWGFPAARESRQALAHSQSRARLPWAEQRHRNTTPNQSSSAPACLVFLRVSWMVLGFFWVLHSGNEHWIKPTANTSSFQGNSHPCIILNIGPIVPVELHVLSSSKFTAVVTPFFWEAPRLFNNNDNLVLVLPRSNNRFIQAQPKPSRKKQVAPQHSF